MRYRHLRRTALAAGAAGALVLLVVVLAVRAVQSEAVSLRLAAWIERGAGAAIGGRVEIGSLGIQVFPPQVVLREVAVQAPGMAVEVGRISVDLDRFRLLRRTLELDAVVADRVRLSTSRPLLTSRRDGPGWLRLSVRQLAVTRLTVDELPLTGEIAISARQVDAAWTVVDGPPRGFLRVAGADLSAPGIEPFRLGFEGRFRLDEELEVPRWRIHSEGLGLTGRGRIGLDGVVAVEAEGSLDLAELDRVLRAKASLSGRASIAVELDVRDGAPRVRADVRSSRLGAVGFELEGVRGRVELADGVLIGVLEEARWSGGRIAGRYRLGRLGPPFPHRVELEAEGLELARFLTTLGVPPTPVGARVGARVELAWDGKGILTGRGQGRADLTPMPVGIPGQGRIAVALEGDGVLRFSADGLQLGGSRVTWQGPLRIGEWEPAWSIRAEPAVVEEIAVLVGAWAGSEVIPPECSGLGTVQATLSGGWKDLVVELRIDLERASYPPLVFNGLVGDATWRAGALSIGPTRFGIGASGGEIEGRLVTDPDGGPLAVDLDLRARDLPLDRVAPWIGLPETVSGSAALAGGLRGRLGDLSGSGALVLTDVAVAGVEIGNASAVIDVDRDALSVRALEFDRGLRGEVVWAPGRGEVSGTFAWPGVPIGPLGSVPVRLLGQTAGIEGSFRLAPGEPTTAGVELTGGDARATATIGPLGVEAALQLGEAATAEIALERLPDGGLAGGGMVRVENVAALLTRLGVRGGAPLEGRIEASLKLDLPGAGAPRLEGRVEALELALEGRPVRLIEPATFEVGSGGAGFPGVRLGLLGDEVFVRGSVDPGGGLHGNLSGTVDALLLRFLAPEWEPAGRATGVVELLGTLDEPRLEGVARVTEGSFRIPGGREVLSGVSGTVLFSSDEVVLEGMSFRFMRGVGTGRGTVGFAEAVPSLLVEGDVSGLEYPLFPGLTPRLAGHFRLEGPVDDLALSGDLQVRQATLRRRDELATIISDWFLGESAPEAAGGGVALDLAIEADRTLEARSSFLRLVGSASLVVTGTSTNPGLVGSVEFMEGGDFTFQGVRYELDRGVITFSDPSRIDPYLDLAARGWIDTTQVTVRMTGTMDRLVPVVTSDPPLPEAQLLSMMAFGRSGEGLGGTNLGLGVASSLLARQLNTELERRARELLPIDQVRVDPFAEASTGNPTARVTVVKQLGASWSLMLQTNLSTNREEVVVLRWFLGQGLFLEATRDLDGSVGLDVKLRRRY